jgi:hypothetical protein
LASAALVALAHGSSGALPRPLLRAEGQATALAASGGRIAVASTCDVRLVDQRKEPRLFKPVGFCRGEARPDSAVIGLWLGRKTIVEEVLIAPSPHGETHQLWVVPVRRGPLRELGEWGYHDTSEPPGYGCDWSIAAGGGVVAMARAPNTLGDEPVCVGIKTSQIFLRGALDRRLSVAGSWGVLATDGKRIALRERDQSGTPTERLRVIGVNGTRLATPRFRAADAKRAVGGWFTRDGLFLYTRRGVVGPGSKLLANVDIAGSPTVGEGRLLYLRNRQVRVRRLRGGPDRKLLTLPTKHGEDAEIAAGSFGLAVMTGTISEKTTLYRIPWRTIDRTLPK